MADRRVLIPEIARPGMRNGRHVNHDPQSLRFLAANPARAVVPKSVRHERHSPTLDQGQLGSCVANTMVELLTTDPFWSTLSPELQQQLRNPIQAERYAVALYRDLTRADPFPGSWEPDDTGSDGLTGAKVLKRRSLITGYRHATSFAGFLAAVQDTAVAVGTVWLSGMNSPSREGIVRATGTVDGGHEWLCREVDVDRELVWGDNHWTDQWGLRGRFAVPFADFEKLLADQGDVTALVPITQPAPVPTPVPVDEVDPPFPLDAISPWLEGRHYTKRERTAAAAVQGWLEQSTD